MATKERVISRSADDGTLICRSAECLQEPPTDAGYLYSDSACCYGRGCRSRINQSSGMESIEMHVGLPLTSMYGSRVLLATYTAIFWFASLVNKEIGS